MIVIGGTYSEVSDLPAFDRVGGSGLRAALVARALGVSPRLVTAAADPERMLVEATINGYGIEAEVRRRSTPIQFSYFTPLDTPVINDRNSRLDDLDPVVTDSALVFGMVEGRPPVRAERIVFDPQQPVGLSSEFRDGLEASHLAVVLNTAEATAVTGIGDPEAAAASIAALNGVDGVVVKRGARGAVVAFGTEMATVGPRWSDHVAPLGTGDCFSAAFASAWISGADMLSAAEIASSATAQYTANGEITPPPLDPTGGTSVPVNDAKVYLAAPFFSLAELWQVNLCRSMLAPFVFSPFHEVGPGGAEVAAADIKGLETCNSLFAIVEGNDPGTLYEAGWAAARGLPVVAYAARPDLEGAKMITGLGGELHDDLATALYRAAWHAMENLDAVRS